MRSRALAAFVGVMCSWSGAVSHGEAWGAEIKPADDAPQPLTPAESIQQFRLPAGFGIELVAGEPLLGDPVAMAITSRGIWTSRS